MNRSYLRLNIQTGMQPCGSVDFISDKINFNISGKSFSFKGMDSIKNITFQYGEGRLVFVFKNTKSLSFNCSVKDVEKVRAHITAYTQADDTRYIKAAFFNN